MRISIVSGTFHPEAGGPPTYLYRLANDLVVRGHRVRVATFGVSSGADRYAFPVRRVSREQPIPLRVARLTWLAWNDARGADLIFANDYGLPPMLANAFAHKPLVMKIVSDFAWEFGIRHAMVSPTTTIDEFQDLRLPARLTLVRRAQAEYAHRADAVIVPSAYLARMVAGWGVDAGRIHVLHNAVERTPPTRPLRRDALRLPERGDLIVTVARLVPWKGIDVLIRATAALLSQGRAVSLVVVGDGEERERLVRLGKSLGIEHALIFVGEVPQPRVADYLACATIFALASSYEGFSHVLLEALAAGAPVVASAVGGNLEVIRHGDNGLLVPAGDAAALAATLARLLDDAALRQRLIQAGSETLEAFAWETLSRRTEMLFRDIVNRKSGSAA